MMTETPENVQSKPPPWPLFVRLRAASGDFDARLVAVFCRDTPWETIDRLRRDRRLGRMDAESYAIRSEAFALVRGRYFSANGHHATTDTSDKRDWIPLRGGGHMLVAHLEDNA